MARLRDRGDLRHRRHPHPARWFVAGDAGAADVGVVRGRPAVGTRAASPAEGRGVSVAPSPAGFWKRYVAYFLDALLLVAVSQGALSLILALTGRKSSDLVWTAWRTLTAPGATLPDLPTAIAMLRELLPELAWLGAISTVAYAVVAVPYALWFEESPHHATLGKQAVGIRVTALDRGPPSRGQVLARVLGAGLSWLTLNLGHALAGWT